MTNIIKLWVLFSFAFTFSFTVERKLNKINLKFQFQWILKSSIPTRNVFRYFRSHVTSKFIDIYISLVNARACFFGNK